MIAAAAFVPRGFYGVVSIDGYAEDTGEAAVAHARVLAAKLLAGGASVLQLRMKHASDATFLAVAQALREVTKAAGVPFVVNDRLDVALAVQADGLHLGQEDLAQVSAFAARQAAAAVGRSLVIGVSTHSPEQAELAARAGADHLGFGPVYATSTKANPDPVQGVAALAEAVRRAAPVPVVAIGGITVARAEEVAAAGAAAACVIAAVNSAADVVAAARAVRAAFAGRARS